MVKMSNNADIVASARYFMDNEDWQGCSQRSGYGAANVENGDRVKYSEAFSEMIHEMYFLPGGRILRNMGRARGSLFNCYVVPMGDSIEQIGDFLRDSLILWSEGGGVGTNLSFLRPNGAPIRGKGGDSSGPVSFLAAADAVAETIKVGGSRRAALLACMHVKHPDIVEFIDAKLVDGRIPNANISVAVDKHFLEAVEQDQEWRFRFAQQDYGTVPAIDIWNKIMHNMVTRAEPGFLNYHNLTKNNSYYFDPIVSTNPCGEVPLGEYGVCDLGSLVLPRFVTNTRTNWKKLGEVIKLAVRFLDNIIELNKYVLKSIDINAHNARRIGLGVMGLADYLFAKQLRYGSKKANYEVERMMRFIRDAAYEASIELSMEKGAFPKFDSTRYGKSHFIRTLPASLRMDIKKHGVRNVTLMAVAPTGTISLLPEVVGGIEPLSFKAYEREDQIGKRMYVHPIYEDIVKGGQATPDWFVDTTDLKPEDHFDTQAMVQKYVDGAVSKTINMAKGTTADMLSDLMLEYIHDLKGVTVYVDGCKEGQILNSVTKKEVKEYLKSNESAGPEAIECSSGSCEI